MVSQVFYINSEKFPVIANDYNEAQTRAEKATKQPKSPKDNNIFTYALESIPTFRRTASLENKVENGEYAATAGILGYTLVNIKEDMRDVVSAGKQIYSKINKNYHYDPLYNRNTHQHDFSFKRGLVGEKYLHKKFKEGNKLAKQIYKMDLTIGDTAFGKAINKIFKTKKVDYKLVEGIKDKTGTCARAIQYKSSILGGEITARAMRRTTVAGVAVLTALELPKIINEFTKGNNIFEHGENGAKQIVKSSVNVASTITGIAYGGAIGSKYGGATGSLVGMGLGAILGSKLSNGLQTSIS